MRRAIYEDDVIKLLDKGWKLGVYPVASNIHALPSAEPEQRWIPCEQRMPEERDWIGTKQFGTTISDEVFVTFEIPGDDCISRKAAIEVARGMSYVSLTPDERECAIRDLPSVQPKPSQVAREIARIIENEKGTRVIEKNTKRGWMSVEDRMPESDGVYLVWGTSGGADEFPDEDPHAFLVDYDSCAGAFGYWYETFDFGTMNGKTGEEFRKVNVAAWQPIDPYQPEEVNE